MTVHDVEVKIKSFLKSQTIFQKFNNFKLLQTPIYHGTSGAWILSKKLDSYIHITNSYSYFAKNPQDGESASPFQTYKIKLQSGENEKTLHVKLAPKASRIIKLKDYFDATSTMVFGSFRLSLAGELAGTDKVFVPYVYTSLIGDKSFSTVHSSSFGTSTFAEIARYTPNFIFSPDITKRCSIVLLSLYPYSQKQKNIFQFILLDPDTSLVLRTFEQSFFGDICCVELNSLIPEEMRSKVFKLTIQGPAAANPYFVLNEQTIFHF